MMRKAIPSAFIILTLGGCLTACSMHAQSRQPLNVKYFGAKGDGQITNTAAIQKALDACASNGGGTVVVPEGDYLTGSLVVGRNTILRLDQGASLTGSAQPEDYPLVRVRWEGEFVQGHRALISAEKADHVSIVGPGSIIGPPLSVARLRNPRGPTLIELVECTNVVLEGFSTRYQQLWSIHPLFCKNLRASNLTIRSTLGNGDGIDVDSCQDVLIEHCDIDTGDDAIAIKSGRGMEAVRLGRPTENVVIRDCTLACSIFAGLAFGSEMSGGIRNVQVENCVISGRQNGISLKSRDGRGGYMENLSFENLTIKNSPTLVAIDLLKKGIQATEPVPGTVEKWARLRNITFNHITVSNVTQLVSATNVPPERLIDGLTFTDITGTCRKAINLANVVNAKLRGIKVTGFQGELLTTNNVQGTGLENPVADTGK